MNLNISDEQLKVVMSAAILQVLDAQSRESIIQEAIGYLMTERQGDWGKKLGTPLQIAMQRALEAVAHKIAQEYVANSEELKAKIKELVEKGMADVLVSGTVEVRFKSWGA